MEEQIEDYIRLFEKQINSLLAQLKMPNELMRSVFDMVPIRS